jgi:chromosome segregation ATPase
MSTNETIKALDAEIKQQEADLQRLREELKAITSQEVNHVNKLFNAVLECPHSITHESVTLHFYPRQKEGHNALAQLHHRLAAYDQEARQREMQLLSEFEALERLALANLKQHGGEE